MPKRIPVFFFFWPQKKAQEGGKGTTRERSLEQGRGFQKGKDETFGTFGAYFSLFSKKCDKHDFVVPLVFVPIHRHKPAF